MWIACGVAVVVLVLAGRGRRETVIGSTLPPAGCEGTYVQPRGGFMAPMSDL